MLILYLNNRIFTRKKIFVMLSALKDFPVNFLLDGIFYFFILFRGIK